MRENFLFETKYGDLLPKRNNLSVLSQGITLGKLLKSSLAVVYVMDWKGKGR